MAHKQARHRQPTIFFFCLDPSLHTKTTAVLNTANATNTRADQLRLWLAGSGHVALTRTSDIPNAASCGSLFHFPRDAEGFSQVTLVWSSRSPIDRSATWTGENKKKPVIHSARDSAEAPILTRTSFFSPLCSTMSWSKTAPNSSWIFCISLMWLATLFIAFIATANGGHKRVKRRRNNGKSVPHRLALCRGLTVQVIVLLAVWVCE